MAKFTFLLASEVAKFAFFSLATCAFPKPLGSVFVTLQADEGYETFFENLPKDEIVFLASQCDAWGNTTS